MKYRTLVYNCDAGLLGYLLEDVDFVRLGGRFLANAFADHHVQLAQAQSGQLAIVDDIKSDAIHCIDHVNIDEDYSSGRWTLNANQRADVRDELADLRVDIY